MKNFLGYRWLAKRYQITAYQPQQVVSLIDNRRQESKSMAWSTSPFRPRIASSQRWTLI
jgi:hypothetical protein